MIKTVHKILFLFVILASGMKGRSQELGHSYVYAGTQIPLQYTIGVQYQVSSKFSASLQAGVLTKPYDKIILSILNGFGTDPALTNTIGSAFSFGFMAQPTVYWHWNKKYYGGLYGSWVYLQANDSPKDAIETYYGVSFDNNSSKFTKKQNEVQLEVISNLLNAGLLVGRNFYIKNSRFQLRTEFSVAKTIGSSSKISSEERDLSKLSEAVNEELKEYYWRYGYFPTLNFYIVYRIGQ